jgi:hypothetical protein
MVHVETLLNTNEPIPQDTYWYVPAGVTPNPVAEVIFNSTNFVMYPASEAKLLEGTEDIRQQALAGNFQGTLEDATKFLVLSMMKKQNLEPITGTNNLFRLSYDYKIFPVIGAPNEFEFKVVLPFDGLAVQAGGAVQMEVIMPMGSKLNAELTSGQLPDGTKIEEQIVELPNLSRRIVFFRWQNDPIFNIRYTY